MSRLVCGERPMFWFMRTAMQKQFQASPCGMCRKSILVPMFMVSDVRRGLRTPVCSDCDRGASVASTFVRARAG